MCELRFPRELLQSEQDPYPRMPGRRAARLLSGGGGTFSQVRHGRAAVGQNASEGKSADEDVERGVFLQQEETEHRWFIAHHCEAAMRGDRPTGPLALTA